MFLELLKNREKKAFLELVNQIVRDSDQQKEIINSYCFEMRIDNIDFDKNKSSITKILSKIKNKKSQKIVLLEIMALVLSDNIVSIDEKKIIDEILDYFKIDKRLADLYREWVKTILSVSNQGKFLITL